MATDHSTSPSRRDDRSGRSALTGADRIRELEGQVELLRRRADAQNVVERAKGVIMALMQCSERTAFAVLVAQSAAEGRDVLEVAVELTRQQDTDWPAGTWLS